MWWIFYVILVIMLAYKNRFHGHNSLRYVYRNGDVYRSQLFTLKISENPRRKTPRIAVVVSKKVLKSAVGRNRIRRRLYEQLRLRLKQFSPQSDIACIVTSRDVATMPASELSHRLGEILSR